MPGVQFENINSYSKEQWQGSIKKLNDIGEILKAVNPLSENHGDFPIQE